MVVQLKRNLAYQWGQASIVTQLFLGSNTIKTSPKKALSPEQLAIMKNHISVVFKVKNHITVVFKVKNHETVQRMTKNRERSIPTSSPTRDTN